MFQIVPFGQLVSTMLRVVVKSFKGISWKFQGCFKIISLVIHMTKVQGVVKDVLMVCLGSFKGVSRVFKDASRKVQEKILIEVSCCMELIAATRVKGGLIFSWTILLVSQVC